MAVLPILTWPDPRLSQVCAPVGGEDVSALAEDMLDTMYDAPGRGLAGPQVGVMRRIFVMDVAWKESTPAPVVVIDPEIVEVSDDMTTGDEGCLSIPGLITPVTRHRWVRMRWTGADGSARDERLDGFAAICAQHEFDHLNGVLTLDRLEPELRTAKETEYRELQK